MDSTINYTILIGAEPKNASLLSILYLSKEEKKGGGVGELENYEFSQKKIYN